MSSVSALKSKFDGAHGGTLVSKQSAKGKAPKSSSKSSTQTAGSYSPNGRKSKVPSPKKQGNKASKEFLEEISLHDIQDESTIGAETNAETLVKSAPNLGVSHDNDEPLKERKAPDPSDATSPRPRKSSGSPKRTVRKTAIKASELGIDLTDVSSEALNAAVNRWRAEQTGKIKADPVVAKGGSKRRQSTGRMSGPPVRPGRVAGSERPKSRAKSRGREDDRDITPNRSGNRSRPKSRGPANRARSKSRSRNQTGELADSAGQDPAGGAKSPTANGVLKRKIIVRRRASVDTPGIGGDTPTLEDAKSPNIEQESSPQGADTAEMCVEAVLGQVPLSPKRSPRKTEVTAHALSYTHKQVSLQRTTQQNDSPGRVASEARGELNEIQKRLKEAGITDDQYHAMIAAGLSISLAT